MNVEAIQETKLCQESVAVGKQVILPISVCRRAGSKLRAFDEKNADRESREIYSPQDAPFVSFHIERTEIISAGQVAGIDDSRR